MTIPRDTPLAKVALSFPWFPAGVLDIRESGYAEQPRLGFTDYDA